MRDPEYAAVAKRLRNLAALADSLAAHPDAFEDGGAPDANDMRALTLADLAARGAPLSFGREAKQVLAVTMIERARASWAKRRVAIDAALARELVFDLATTLGEAKLASGRAEVAERWASELRDSRKGARRCLAWLLVVTGAMFDGGSLSCTKDPWNQRGFEADVRAALEKIRQSLKKHR